MYLAQDDNSRVRLIAEARRIGLQSDGVKVWSERIGIEPIDASALDVDNLASALIYAAYRNGVAAGDKTARQEIRLCLGISQ